MYRHKKLLTILAKIIIQSDFVTVLKKFVDQGANRDEVEEYISTFKELKDKNKIKNNDEKNIDWWGKKTFNDFKEFVDKTKGTKSKSEELKLKKMEGAELVHEDDDYLVYKITSHDAARMYGSGTKWCITQVNPQWWNKYIIRNDFYFFISKYKNKEDPLYKVAMTIDSKGKKTYWDAPDNHMKEPPKEIAKIKYEFPVKTFESSSEVERLVALIQNEIESAEEYAGTIDAYESMIDYIELHDDYRRHLDSDTEEIVDELLEFLGGDEDKLNEILLDCSDNELTGIYYQNNEIARVGVGAYETELDDDLKEDIENLSAKEKTALQALLDDAYIYINIAKDNYNFQAGSEDNNVVAILDSDKLEDRLKELKLADKVERSDANKKQKFINRVALTSKHFDASLAAIKRVTDKNVLKQVLRRKNWDLKIAAIQRLGELFSKDSDVQNLFIRIASNKKIDDKVRLAALKESTTQNLFKKVVLDYIKNEDAWPFSLASESISKINNDDFVKKYGVQNPSLFVSVVEKINDPVFLSSILDVVIKEHNLDAIDKIIEKLPDSYQDDFKKVAVLPLNYHHWKTPDITAIKKITDQNFLFDLFKKKEKKEDSYHEEKRKKAIIETVNHDTLDKIVEWMPSDLIATYDTEIIDNLSEDSLKKFLKKTNNYFAIRSILDKLPKNEETLKLLKGKPKELLKDALEYAKNEIKQFYKEKLGLE